MKTIILSLSLLFTSSLLFGQISTDRPDQCDGGTVIPKGTVQIEVGYAFAQSQYLNSEIGGGMDFKSTTHTLANPLVRIGLHEAFELRLLSALNCNKIENLSNNEVVSESSGWTSPMLGTKIQLYENSNGNTALALLGHIALDDGLFGDGDLSHNTRLALSQGINDILGFGLNVGTDGTGDQTSLFTSAVLGISSNTPLSGFIEVFASTPMGEEDAEFAPWFDAGLIYLVNDQFQLDFSFGLDAFVENGSDWFVGTGVSFNISD